MHSERQMELTTAKERGWLDLTGAAVSWMCVVPCAALPFFVSLPSFVVLGLLPGETYL